MKEPSAQSTVAVRYGFNHKIKTECAYQNKAIPVFLGSTAALCVLSLLYLDVDWIKLAGRVPDMGSIFYRLAQFDFKYMDLIAAAMWETLSITVLSTIVQCYFRFVFWHVCGRKYFPYALAVGTGAVMVYLFACRADAGMGAFNDGVPRHGACRRYCRFVRAYDGVFYSCFRAEL